MDVNRISAIPLRIRQNISRVIIGKDDVIEKLLAALFAGGHVLIEDVPGTGKTVMAKALARSIDGVFRRIQFTPDLLPGDVTGMSVYSQKSGEFEFHPGPVFTNVLLADEINRATPRSQSSLLECMEERQVTADGVTRKLDRPFFVVATQNPIEIQGTFPLPEAQLDRFLVRLWVGYPSSAESIGILDRFRQDNPLDTLAPAATAAEVAEVIDRVPNVFVSQPVKSYIVALAERTRAQENVLLGVSPRGCLSMMRAAQALSLIRGRDYVLPDDVKSLAPDVFAHRMIIKNAYGSQSKRAIETVQAVLDGVDVPTEDTAREGMDEK